jgi:hypothetical protein
MRHFVLTASLCSSACFIGPDDAVGDSTGSASTMSEDTDVTAGPSTTVNMSGPGEATGSPEGSTSPADPPTTDDTSVDTSTGEMSGCESGPLPAPIPGCTPVPPASTGDPAQDCVERINQFRWECQCLPPLARWADAETCSDEQSAADQVTGAAHGNFGMCGEYAQNTCPNWGSEQDVVSGCLQAMWDEGPGEPFEAHGHYINMSNTDYAKVACGFSASGAGVWANQNFSP